jgi:N-acetylmuramoyl-L-alanine amidase
MKKGVLAAGLLFCMVLAATEEGWADYRLVNIRKWSAPDYTRVVLDLDGPPTYEIQSAANSAILILYLPKLILPRGPQEVPVEDKVIHKVKLDPGDRPRITFFLYQPSRWKVFTLEPDSERPDRLVIDVFKPAPESKEKAEKLAGQDTKDQKAVADKIEEPSRKIEKPWKAAEPPQKTEEPLRKVTEPSQKSDELPQKIAELPRKITEPPQKIAEPPRVIKEPSRKMEEPARSVSPEQPREKEIAPARTGFPLAKLLDIRHWPAPDHTRVVIDLDGAPNYEVLPSTDSLVYTLNLRGVKLPKGGKEIPVADQVIQKMKVEIVGTEEAKLTLILVKPSRLDVFLLKPFEDKPDRLVIDISRPDLEEKEKVERQASRELKAKKKRIIILDPGHGGDDPGATGPKGTMEKDIVLALAQRLQKSLDATGEVRAFLTRRGDYFVPLQDRVKIAQEYGADLFISLHANGSRSRQIHGTSLYCLSLKVASDTATQLLAQKENSSDMIGGISAASARRDLDSILLDLEQTQSINDSLHLGGIVLRELSRVNRIQFSQPHQAGFAVLKAPEYPSILVETAYITHPAEEMLLGKKSFQDKLCEAITAAVKKFVPLLAIKEGESAAEPRETQRGKRGG